MDRPIWVRLLAVLEHNPESTTVTLNRASAEEMLHEIKRLQDGGCARNQGLTQYCAEAAEKDVEIASLKAEVERARVREQELADEANRLLGEVKASDKRIFYLTAEVARLREFVLFVDKWTNYKPSKPHQPTSYENCVKTIAPMAAEFRAALTPSHTGED